MDAEVEQAGEAHPHDGIQLAAALVAGQGKTLVQQRRHREGSGTERLRLPLLIPRVKQVEVHLRQVAVEVGADDLAAGIEAVAAEAVLQFLGAEAGVVEAEPAAGLLSSLVAEDLHKLGL